MSISSDKMHKAEEATNIKLIHKADKYYMYSL